jgi:uncharacterized protein (TIGR03083 family)
MLDRSHPRGGQVLPVAGPLDVTQVLEPERSALLALLRSLDDDGWRRPTDCPAYDVQGVATHLLGDDLSLLSRQRDSAVPGVFAVLAPGDDFRTALDRFNDRWVESAAFLSPALVLELLDLTGWWTADWYRAVELEAPGEPVGFFGATGPSPYWQVAAREYVERWIHHHQIRRALGRPNLDADAFLAPAVGTVVRGIAAHLRDLEARPGDSIVLTVVGLASWTLLRHDDGWQLLEGAADDARARLGLDRSLATDVFSRGLPAAEVEAAISLDDDVPFARRAARGLAALSGS